MRISLDSVRCCSYPCHIRCLKGIFLQETTVKTISPLSSSHWEEETSKANVVFSVDFQDLVNGDIWTKSEWLRHFPLKYEFEVSTFNLVWLPVKLTNILESQWTVLGIVAGYLEGHDVIKGPFESVRLRHFLFSVSDIWFMWMCLSSSIQCLCYIWFLWG